MNLEYTLVALGCLGESVGLLPMTNNYGSYS